MSALADAEPICIAVLEAKTQRRLSLILDESDWPKAEKYRWAFEHAIASNPQREIVVVRVPLSTWTESA